MRNLLLSLLLIAACGAAPVKAVDDARIGKTEFHSVVQLQNALGRTFCSGVIVDHKVMTAYHCIDGGEPVFVETVEGRWEAAVWGTDETSDLAVLVPVDGRKLPRGVRLARKAPSFGEEVWVIGHPLGKYTNSITRGIVSHPQREDGIFGGLWMQHDAGTIGGNSGGPVFDSKGRLVGIVSFGIISGVYCTFNCTGVYQDTHINGAVHLSPIRALLR
jgi:S1-C subfamily serine protease